MISDDNKIEDQSGDELKAFAALHAEYMTKREEAAADYVEKLIEKGYDETAEELKAYRHSSILICEKDTPEGGVPVGASKIGGLPDLPPEIEYPKMTGYTYRMKDESEDRNKTYPESAMHLVMQINLRELAESGADIEGLFPKTGMFYIFWSGEEDEFLFDPDNDYITVNVDDPEYAHINKVIWWDGDMSTLRRTEPTLPYYEEVYDDDIGDFNEICPERMIDFDQQYDYDKNAVDEIDDLMELLEDADEDDFIESCDKIFGLVDGGNAPELSDDELLLLQLDYSIGCIWTLFWIMKKDKFLERDFSDVYLYADCD